MEIFARVDSKTGKGINEGFCFGDGDAYFARKKHAKKYAKKQGYATLKESYKDKNHYWTTWYDTIDEENDTWYDADGKEHQKCKKCHKETTINENFYFCTHCLTHL